MQSTSSAAYKVLLEENVLCIPSTSTLAKVTRRLDTSTGLNNAAYLKLRVSKLNEFDRNVILMIDEIYNAKRVECSGGEVQGLTADGAIGYSKKILIIHTLLVRQGCMASAGARAYMGVWRLCPQWGPGAKPLVRGSGAKPP